MKLGDDITLRVGNVLEQLAEIEPGSIDCLVTSPPYLGLRDYGSPPVEWPAVSYSPMAGLPAIDVPPMVCSLGLEADPYAFVGHLVAILREARHTLTRYATVWINLGDSYSGRANGGATFDRHRGAGHKAGIIAPQTNTIAHAPYKSLLGVPWRLAFALQAEGWVLRNDIIWNKTNAMPESVIDRLARRYEDVFVLSRGPRYYYDLHAIRAPRSQATLDRYRYEFHEYDQGLTNHLRSGGMVTKADPAGRNPGDYWEAAEEWVDWQSTWTIPTQPYGGAHFATFPEELARRCIRAGCPERVCTTCGEPSRRLVQSEQVDTRPGGNGPRSVDRRHEEFGTAGFERRTMSVHSTAGWSDCGHGAWRRGRVLDPFAGSGTTMLVARQQGRHSEGIELNPGFVPMIEDRVAGRAPRRVAEVDEVVGQGTLDFEAEVAG